MIRAAAYLRVSSEPQEAKYGFEIQVDTVNAYAEKVGARILSVYRDVITGTSPTRVGLEKLKAEAHQYDAVIIPRTDRLARDILVGPAIVTELMAAGLTVHMSDFGAYNPDDAASVFMFAMSLAKSHTDRTTIVSNLTAGKIAKAKRGELVRPIKAYGYRDNQPHEPEAKWVRQIYQWMLAMGHHSVAKRLNDIGVPTPRGGKAWRPSTLQAILQNKVYKGIWEYGRTLRCPKCKATATARDNDFRVVNRPTAKCRCGETMELERYQIPVRAIVETSLWDRVHSAQRARMKKRSRPGSRRETFPLQGRMTCGECGGAMSCHIGSSKKYAYYYCYGSIARDGLPARCTHTRHYPAAEINEHVWAYVRLVHQHDSLLQATLELPAAPVVDYEREREQLREELRNYIRLAGRGLITDDELHAERQRIERALDLIPNTPPAKPVPEARHLEAWRTRVGDSLISPLEKLATAADLVVKLSPGKILHVTFR